MNKNVATVIQGFASLDEADKKEFLKQLEKYQKYPTLTRDEIKKSLGESYSISLGPSPNSCPCCGK